MPRRQPVVKHSHPLNRELRLDFSTKLAKCRKLKFQDNEAAAALAAGLDPSQYHRYETGQVLPTLPVLVTILDSWGLTWSEFNG